MKLKVISRLAVAGFLCAYSLTAGAQKTTESRTDLINGIKRLNVMSDSDQGNDKTMILEKNGDKYRIRVIDNKITELEINGKKQPETEFAKYDPMITAILEQIAKDRAQAEKDRQQAERDREQADRDRERADLDRIRAEKDRAQAAVERDRADLDRVRAEKDRDRADAERRQADKEREHADLERDRADVERRQSDRERVEAEKHRQSANEDRVRAEEDRRQADLDRERAEVDRKRAEEDRRLFESLIDELISDKLIKSKSGFYEIDLNADSFTVDGKKQPDAVHQKYKSKYLKQHKVMRFSSDGNSRRIQVNDHD